MLCYLIYNIIPPLILLIEKIQIYKPKIDFTYILLTKLLTKLYTLTHKYD